MAPPLQVDNGGLLRLIWSVSGEPYAVNVMAFSGTASQPPTTAIATTVAAAIATGYTNSALNAQHSTLVTLSSIGLRSINVANQAEVPATVAGAAGTSSTPMLPQQVAAVVTVRTALAGRRFRGRVYLPGWAQIAGASSSAFTTAAGTAALSFISTVGNALFTSNYTLSVLSRPVFQEVTPPTIPPTFILIRAGQLNTATSFDLVDHRWDTQRRRLNPGI